MTDLSTTWLGLPLAHPIMASSSPLTGSVESLRRLESAGIAAATLPSLFEEEIRHEAEQLAALVDLGVDAFGEATSGFLPPPPDANVTDRYLRLVESAKKAVDIPIVASLNGVTPGGWLDNARRIQEAGADGLELNIYLIATEIDASAADVENRYLELIETVCSEVSIPVAVKVGPFFSSLPNMVGRIGAAGASGVSLFNRFYQPDLDIESLRVVPDLQLSTSADLRLPLRWTAILSGRVSVDIGVTSGVHRWSDVAKCLLAGANVTMMAAALLRSGGAAVESALDGLRHWMIEHEFSSVRRIIGSMSQRHVEDPAMFERTNYMRALQTFANPVN